MYICENERQLCCCLTAAVPIRNLMSESFQFSFEVEKLVGDEETHIFAHVANVHICILCVGSLSCVAINLLHKHILTFAAAKCMRISHLFI